MRSAAKARPVRMSDITQAPSDRQVSVSARLAWLNVRIGETALRRRAPISDL